MENDFVKTESREDFENQLHFSYSQLSTFLICPMKYAHQYVWGTQPETKPVALPFGRAIHKAAEAYYRTLKDTGEIAPVDQVIAAFEMVFDNDIKSTEVELTLKEDETLGTIREQGVQLLKLFCQEIRPQTIAAIESSFSVAVPDILNGGGELPIKLVGFFDLVERDEH